MKRAWGLLLFFLCAGVAFAAEESFDSKIMSKESAQVYGNGTLSAATTVYTIVVSNKGEKMRIDLSKEAYDLLHVGDQIKITIDRGWFAVQIKGIKLIQLAEDSPQ